MKPLFAPSLTRLLSLLLFVALLTGCAPQKQQATGGSVQPPCISKGWPQDHSDLRSDPALTFGMLGNGLRYVIMENHEPKDRVAMYLDVQAGSLNESEEQRGYAHFLEHMVFNGSTHFPPGTLVKYFQSIGMAFGSDSNAHTAYDETVYNLLLPDGSPKHMEEGLLVMADYARGALLREDEVNRERGVILAEKRTRDSADYRVYEKEMQFSFARTRLARRMPIGTEETLAKADSAMLRSFYDSWYRPENMILVIVGPVEPKQTEKLVAGQLGALTAPKAQPLCFDYGEVDDQATTALYLKEPELGKTEVSITSRWNTTPRNDSLAWQSEQVKRYLVANLFNNRLKRLVSEKGSPLTKADNYAGIYLGRFGYASISAVTEGEKWQQALSLLNTTLRQALEAGFTEQELLRVKKQFRAELEMNVQTAGGRDSRKLAGQIIDKLNRNEVILSPRQDLELFGPVSEGFSLAAANQLFRSLWSHPAREIVVEGTAKIEPDKGKAENTILQVFRESQQQKLSAWNNGGQPVFPYLEVPKAEGTMIRRPFQKIGVQQVIFGNQAVLNIKQTNFKPNEVLVSVQFGRGQLGEPKPGMSLLAESVVNESGVGKLTHTELDEALAGHTAAVNFHIGQESFSLNGSGLSSELELLFQLIMTRLRDPAFRDEAFQLSRERFAQMYDQMESSVEGGMQLQGEKFLAGGDIHYGLPPRTEFMRLTLPEIRAWIAPVFTAGPLEVSVVGDVKPDQVIALAAKYLGSLAHGPFPATKTRSLTFPAGKKLETRVPTTIDKTLLVMAWPTDDFWDISRTRRLNILADVLEDRVREEIREKLGAAYSPAVYSLPSRVAPGYGMIRAMMEVDPTRAEDLAQRVRKVAADLAKDGVRDEELRRSLGPSLTGIKDLMKTNRYWLESVLILSSRHPEQLAWPLTIERDFASITAADISAFAARYLQPGKAAEILLQPEVRP